MQDNFGSARVGSDWESSRFRITVVAVTDTANSLDARYNTQIYNERLWVWYIRFFRYTVCWFL